MSLINIFLHGFVLFVLWKFHCVTRLLLLLVKSASQMIALTASEDENFF